MKTDTPSFAAYSTYGAACAEVEVDILTGQYLINRVDILYDCGKRYNKSSHFIPGDLNPVKGQSFFNGCAQ